MPARKKKPTDRPSGPARVYGYARVSTTQEADEGESPDVQQRQIAGYAQMHGLEVARTFMERVSGGKPLSDRPEGKALLALLRPGDVLITSKLDRMFRSSLDALDVLGKLKGQGVSLHIIDLGGDTTGNGVSKLVFTILSAVADAERDRTRQRIAKVKRDQRSRGRYLGGKVPFGWRVGDDGELVAVPEEQEAIKRMKRLKAKGTSLRSIAEAMKTAGFWLSHVGIRDILDREASRGNERRGARIIVTHAGAEGTKQALAGVSTDAAARCRRVKPRAGAAC